MIIPIAQEGIGTLRVKFIIAHYLKEAQPHIRR